jgi:hypothetical protein
MIPLTLDQAARMYAAKADELNEDVSRFHAADAGFGFDAWDENTWAENEARVHSKLREYATSLGFDHYELEQHIGGDS